MSRKDFWTTVVIIGSFAVSFWGLAFILEPLLHEEGLAMGVRQLLTFVVVIPTISMFCRRMNDTGFPLWMAVVILFPWAGLLLVAIVALPADSYYFKDKETR
jgi:uncharacterized membrane protein YhaH (DUF805 family)